MIGFPSIETALYGLLLILNADAGFDSKDFRRLCDRKEVNANICLNKRNGGVRKGTNISTKTQYDERYAEEPTNAWVDGLRSLLNRFPTTTESRKGFNYLAFIAIALINFKKKKFKPVLYQNCKHKNGHFKNSRFTPIPNFIVLKIKA